MNFNWDDALAEIIGHHLVCPRCQRDQDALVVGYSRRPSLSPFAPRHGECPQGTECDSRKLVTLCADCAVLEHLRGVSQDASHVLVSYMLDCRHELDESVGYLGEYWRDDPDLADEDLDRSLEEVNPDAFHEESALRQKLEEEYLRYHRELRAQHHAIPDPGWRSAYVEEICELGYRTLLGD